MKKIDDENNLDEKKIDEKKFDEKIWMKKFDEFFLMKINLLKKM